MKFTRELQDRVVSIMNNEILHYPQAGSSGVYINPLVVNLIELNGNQIKLFWLMVAATDEYNQVHKTRKELGSMYMRSYNASNISSDIKKLIELEMIAYVGNTVMVNPFIVLPSMKNPKLKAAIQVAWRELVEFA